MQRQIPHAPEGLEKRGSSGFAAAFAVCYTCIRTLKVSKVQESLCGELGTEFAVLLVLSLAMLH